MLFRSENALLRILQEPKNALTKQYHKLFELDGVELDFEDEALRVMARKSMERKTGARGLRAIMESTLMDLMYKTPSDDTIRKCIITKEAVEGTGEPQIVHGEAPAQPVNPANTGRRSQRASYRHSSFGTRANGHPHQQRSSRLHGRAGFECRLYAGDGAVIQRTPAGRPEGDL